MQAFDLVVDLRQEEGEARNAFSNFFTLRIGICSRLPHMQVAGRRRQLITAQPKTNRNPQDRPPEGFGFGEALNFLTFA